jgi:hypothetical protein
MNAASVREGLERILVSPGFEASARNRRFLAYIVGETLAGRTDRLKGLTIAIDVFGRDATIDPQHDPVVRIEAAKLRRSLERYYLTAGQQDPIRIYIPKGAYVPTFEERARVPVSKSIRLGSVAAGSAGLAPTAAKTIASAAKLPKSASRIIGSLRFVRPVTAEVARIHHDLNQALPSHHGYEAGRKTQTAAPSPSLARTAR